MSNPRSKRLRYSRITSFISSVPARSIPPMANSSKSTNQYDKKMITRKVPKVSKVPEQKFNNITIKTAVKRATSVAFFVAYILIFSKKITKNRIFSKKYLRISNFCSNFAAYSVHTLAWEDIFCTTHVGEVSNKCSGIRT